MYYPNYGFLREDMTPDIIQEIFNQNPEINRYAIIVDSKTNNNDMGILFKYNLLRKCPWTFDLEEKEIFMEQMDIQIEKDLVGKVIGVYNQGIGILGVYVDKDILNVQNHQ